MDDTSVTAEWEQSAELGELAKALSAAQGEMENASKSKDNPFFKSKYADLAAIKDVSQASLTKHVLAVTGQNFTRGPEAGVRMMLLHGSGQYLACTCTTTPKDRGPQAMGSCWTYLRRYAKSALLDIATEDDDAEKAEGRNRDAKPPGTTWKPKAKTTPDTGEVVDAGQLADLHEAIDKRWGRGAKTAAPSWLRANFGTDNPANLTREQATDALQKLLAS